MSSSSAVSEQRVLSGMRPTGSLHLGHYHGVLQNWVKLQHEYECFFFVADWHALTTHYEDPRVIEQSVWDMVIDWLNYMAEARATGKFEKDEEIAEEAFDMHMRQLAGAK